MCPSMLCTIVYVRVLFDASDSRVRHPNGAFPKIACYASDQGFTHTHVSPFIIRRNRTARAVPLLKFHLLMSDRDRDYLTEELLHDEREYKLFSFKKKKGRFRQCPVLIEIRVTFRV